MDGPYPTTEMWILDTETTGLAGKPCEVGGIRINEQAESLEQFNQRIYPERPIEAKAFAVHGISDADVADCPTMEDAFGVQSITLDWIGYNAAFDVRVCDPVLKPNRVLCVLKLARQFLPGLPSYKLQSIREALDLPVHAAHEALGDCKTTLDLLRVIIDRSGLSLSTLFDRQNAPRMVYAMPWGKHQGRLLIDLPADYLDWLRKLPDLDADMRYTLKQMEI